MKMFNRVLEDAAGCNPAGDGASSISVEQDGPRLAYVMDFPPAALPPPFATMFRPTIILGKDQLIVAASTTAAEQAVEPLRRPPGQRRQPAGAFVPVVHRLPANMVYLNISDPRKTMPAMIEALPILAQQMNAQTAQQQRMRPPGVGGPPPGAPLSADRPRQPPPGRRARPPPLPRLDGPGR